MWPTTERKKNQSTETDSEMTKMMELAYKGFKSYKYVWEFNKKHQQNEKSNRGKEK